VAVQLAGDGDVWVYDLARATPTRISFRPEFDNFPFWTPDGERVLFQCAGEGLCWARADGTGGVETLRKTRAAVGAFSWSADSTVLLFSELSPETRWDIFTLAMGGERRAEPLLQTPFNEVRPAISPDGRWLAYASDESGDYQVYVRPFPNVGDRKWTISRDGGVSPIWSRDGKELFLRNGGAMMRVPIQTSPTFSPGAPEVLFEGQFVEDVLGGRGAARADLAPDGQRFLMLKPFAEAGRTSDQIVIVVNGLEEIKRRNSH
jgi:serine/threonine-protein kinase